MGIKYLLFCCLHLLPVSAWVLWCWPKLSVGVSVTVGSIFVAQSAETKIQFIDSTVRVRTRKSMSAPQKCQ